MPYDVVEARHVGGFIIWLRFRDGTTGEIDLNAELHGPMFEPLRDPVLFARFRSTRSSKRLSGRTERISLQSFCTTRCA
jgi:hypothetical protein